MRYIGSKGSTVESVYALVSKRVTKGTLCDPFGGIGVVGAYFKRNGYQVWSGDILTFAHYFQIAQIAVDTNTLFSSLMSQLRMSDLTNISDYLNGLTPADGWFVKEYSENRRYFTLNNAKCIEACWQTIMSWNKEKLIDEMEYAVLIASLINSFDRVANTAGTYYAYLKTWHRKAIQDFHFDLLYSVPGDPNCVALLSEAKDLVSSRFFDILYLDPPYNDRSYSSYYHLPETVARGINAQVHGLSGVPIESRPESEFNRSTKAKRALIEVLEQARFSLLAFHYSDAGLISPYEVKEILSNYGDIEEFILNSMGYSTAHDRRNVLHRLYMVTHA